MRVIGVKRINSDINGNPRYEIDIKKYPECGEIGRKKRMSDTYRIFSAYSLPYELQPFFDEEIRVELIN